MGLKGLRLLVAGVAMFFCVGVAEPKVDASGPRALTAQVQPGANPEPGDSAFESIVVAPFSEPKADAPILIRHDGHSASWAVTGNNGESLDVPVRRGPRCDQHDRARLGRWLAEDRG